MENQYYCITTRRFILRCGHRDWLEQTQKIYNEVIAFYYHLFLDLEEKGEQLKSLNQQQAMRRLEIFTVKGREQNPVDYPLPWQKLPLYVRRAAINAAITAAKSFFDQNEEGLERSRTARFQCAVTFYKGAYRELTENSIELKVWNGKYWVWLHCRLSGNSIPEKGITLSPALILKKKNQFLNLPVKEPVKDGRTARERMVQHSRICSIQFTGGDILATAVILNQEGEQIHARFFRGGEKYTSQCAALLKKIEQSDKKMGLGKNQKTEHTRALESAEAKQPYNQRYWKKLKNISEHYAHDISRQIITYCQEQQSGLLILPEYNKDYTRYVLFSAGNWSSYHLGSRIRRLLFYKSWKAGIVVLEISAFGCSKKCSVCGASVQKKGSFYCCENGHQGNRSLNTARNLGRKCIQGFLGKKE